MAAVDNQVVGCVYNISIFKAVINIHNIRTNARMSNWARMQRIAELTIVVSAMDPKLLIKMLQVTFTGGPAGERRKKD